MMRYREEQVADIIGGKPLTPLSHALLTELAYDSRRIQQPVATLFFCLVTSHGDGHQYIDAAYKRGVRHFVVSTTPATEKFGDASFLQVTHTLAALQHLCAYHRKKFSLPVVGITGSNGKTIVKEWLFQLLEGKRQIVRSPRSYNSQIGAPLSVWQINETHDLGIFEAGISTVGEMGLLERIIQPTIGILTNLGEAHDEGFLSAEQKLEEKCKLFAGAGVVIGEKSLLQRAQLDRPVFDWSREGTARLQVLAVERKGAKTTVTAMYNAGTRTITIPFSDDASLQNALNCWCLLLYLGIDDEETMGGFEQLHAVDMRLQLKHGSNGCVVVNDSYSADTTSLKIALDFLQQQSAGLKRTVILSDFFETGKTDEELYREIAALLHSYGVQKAVLVGEVIGHAVTASLTGVEVQTYLSTEALLQAFNTASFQQEIILVKGARRFGFERIVPLFERKLHQTVLEINLNALAHNLKEYQRHLQPSTKVMAMVKAFSYGSGSAEVASILQYHNVDYLGVAYADEGVELVRTGITLPVMVLNAEAFSFSSIVDYNLEPVMYSFTLLHQFESYIREQGLSAYPVHIEIETGMNRLGFSPDEMEKLGNYLSQSTYFKVQSVFSHLAASEDAEQDEFTLQQAATFRQAAEVLSSHLDYSFFRHISNSAAIIRHPELQFDMVRLGIGLYGIEVDNEKALELQPVATLRSTIAQLKRLPAGASVSYNRRGVLQRSSLIATVRIGYADGYSRRFSGGVGKMWVKGRLAPVVGTVCMDMTMIDVTDIEGVMEGDDVIVFGGPLTVQEVSGWARTIPYELMTAVSQRVKRVYFQE